MSLCAVHPLCFAVADALNSSIFISPRYTDLALAQCLPRDVFDSYMSARLSLKESEQAAKLEQQYEQRLQTQLEALRKLDEHERSVRLARLHIEENILTKRCPRCNAAFLSFDACFAVSCAHCPCNFCAWCLKDCGDDAHAHVLRCEFNLEPGKGLFSTEQLWDRAGKLRIQAKLREWVIAFAR